MKINLTGLEKSNEEKNSKSMRRPHSYDREINKSQEQAPVSQTERKKKSFSTHKKEFPKQKRKANSVNNTGLKLDGLQMVPPSFKKLEEEECFQFSQKLASNTETTKIGGNIFINNNINLFISKDNLSGNGLETKIKGDKTVYEISRRQNFINKRKAHQSNFTGAKNP